jgi:hypothetical protein
MNRVIGWVEQEQDGAEAFYCFREKSGATIRWRIKSLECELPQPPEGKGQRSPLGIAA